MDNKTFLNKKEIKKYILDASSDLEILIDYLEYDYQDTIEGIFNAIFTLMRHYEQNKSRIFYLIDLVEGTTSFKSSQELNGLMGPIIDLQNKIDGLKLKDRMVVREPMVRIQNILLNANQEIANSVHNKKIKYLSFLIFQEKNVLLIEKFLKENKGIFSSRNEDGENIFEILLKKYLYLDEKDYDEIGYFYHVILIFMNSCYRGEIEKGKKGYVDMIKKSKLGYKEHIIRILELFDPDFEISLEKIEERYHMSFEFLPSIMDEVNTFSMDKGERVNFLYQECVTIDGDGSNCLDDALYLEKNDDGTYTLYVHITDIPSFVPYDSVTDMEARKRGETLYLRDRKILLYPSIISDQICSLLPLNHRNVITYIFHLDSNYQVIEDDFSFAKGKIQVCSRLSYEEADTIIFSNRNDSLAIMLRRMANFAENRRRGNVIRERYREYQNVFDYAPHHESIQAKVSPSSNIVHESMVLTNYQIGKYFKEMSLPYLYRKIDLPSESFLQEQLLSLKNLDPSFLQNKEIYQRIKDSYTRAEYINKPVYHRGQDLECYSHSTSPARRYADAFNQYLIYDFIFREGMSSSNIYKWEYQLNDLVYYLNKKKRENEVFSNHYNYLSGKNLIKKK